MKKLIGYAFLAAIAFFLLLQLVPYGRNHTNPPVESEPAWAHPQARQVAQSACFDCHSNQTIWPWYSHIAPVSWLVYRDVEEGRSKLNFSEWSTRMGGEEGVGEAVEEIEEEMQKGKMPMPIYLLLHPSAKLSRAEQDLLIKGLRPAASQQ